MNAFIHSYCALYYYEVLQATTATNPIYVGPDIVIIIIINIIIITVFNCFSVALVKLIRNQTTESRCLLHDNALYSVYNKIAYQNYNHKTFSCYSHCNCSNRYCNQLELWWQPHSPSWMQAQAWTYTRHLDNPVNKPCQDLQGT